MTRATWYAVWCLIAGAILTAAACGNTATGPSTPTNIAGTWAVTGTISNASVQITCNLQGTATLQQSGSNFTGQVSNSTTTCTGPGGTVAASADGPITGGQVSGSSVSYADVECSYTGTISGSPSNRMQGPVSCQIPILGQTYTFAGTWNASR